MSYPIETNPDFTGYAHPEALVSTKWVEENIGQKGLVIVECDEDILLYSTGHIATAVKIDWHTELNHPDNRDYIDGEAFAALLSSKGINRDDTIVLYGDKSNWWATYAMWVFKLFGHADIRIMNGGRAKWVEEGRELTKEVLDREPTNYPVVERDDSTIRAFNDDVIEHFGKPMIDVRSLPEYTGEKLHMPDYPNEGASRGGHIPSARSVPWGKAVREDQTFRTIEELNQTYRVEAGIADANDVIAYCRIGERSSHTWFVLTYLLGIPKVRNYDGSWTEWGSSVKVPIVKGEEPGAVPVSF
jgi:thiosulfate/3-mercaptopyruvate sulfurtransferase